MEKTKGSGFLKVTGILMIIGGGLSIILGIVSLLGVANCKKPEKATACLVWGIIVAVVDVLSNVLAVVAGGDFSVSSLILGLVLPVLFIIGAALNKQQA